MNQFKLTLKQKFDSPSRSVSYLIFESDQKFSFKEGQFMMLEATLNGKLTKRAYSIATTYKFMEDANQIGFLVKQVSEAGMSHHLTKKIKIGDVLISSGPFGHLTNDFGLDDYLLINIGSGFACIKSIFENIIQENRFNKVVNIFGERFFDNIVPQAIDNLKTDNPNILCINYFSKEDISIKGTSEGNIRIYKGHVQDGISKALEFLDTKDIKVFICGKPDMADEIRDTLIANGINIENIKIEKY